MVLLSGEISECNSLGMLAKSVAESFGTVKTMGFSSIRTGTCQSKTSTKWPR